MKNQGGRMERNSLITHVASRRFCKGHATSPTLQPRPLRSKSVSKSDVGRIPGLQVALTAHGGAKFILSRWRQPFGVRCEGAAPFVSVPAPSFQTLDPELSEAKETSLVQAPPVAAHFNRNSL